MARSFMGVLAVCAPLAVFGACTTSQSEVSVEGLEGTFCAEGTDICMGTRSDGACPGPQTGLEYGSFCGVVSSGVYGCKVNDKSTSWSSGVGAASSVLVPGPFRCGGGLSAMSVEGVDLVFCVLEPACAADEVDGNCPGAQDRLPFGSYCDRVRTGVYGCKPFNSTDELPNDVVYPPPYSCDGNPAGDTAVSVEGKGTFCASYPVCSGTIAGSCPAQQPGLEKDSTCAIIKTGVYGCVVTV